MRQEKNLTEKEPVKPKISKKKTGDAQKSAKYQEKAKVRKLIDKIKTYQHWKYSLSKELSASELIKILDCQNGGPGYFLSGEKRKLATEMLAFSKEELVNVTDSMTMHSYQKLQSLFKTFLPCSRTVTNWTEIFTEGIFDLNPVETPDGVSLDPVPTIQKFLSEEILNPSEKIEISLTFDYAKHGYTYGGIQNRSINSNIKFASPASYQVVTIFKDIDSGAKVRKNSPFVSFWETEWPLLLENGSNLKEGPENRQIQKTFFSDLSNIMAMLNAKGCVCPFCDHDREIPKCKFELITMHGLSFKIWETFDLNLKTGSQFPDTFLNIRFNRIRLDWMLHGDKRLDCNFLTDLYKSHINSRPKGPKPLAEWNQKTIKFEKLMKKYITHCDFELTNGCIKLSGSQCVQFKKYAHQIILLLDQNPDTLALWESKQEFMRLMHLPRSEKSENISKFVLSLKNAGLDLYFRYLGRFSQKDSQKKQYLHIATHAWTIEQFCLQSGLSTAETYTMEGVELKNKLMGSWIRHKYPGTNFELPKLGPKQPGQKEMEELRIQKEDEIEFLTEEVTRRETVKFLKNDLLKSEILKGCGGISGKNKEQLRELIIHKEIEQNIRKFRGLLTDNKSRLNQLVCFKILKKGFRDQLNYLQERQTIRENLTFLDSFDFKEILNKLQ